MEQQNDMLKGVVEALPQFTPLLTASEMGSTLALPLVS